MARHHPVKEPAQPFRKDCMMRGKAASANRATESNSASIAEALPENPAVACHRARHANPNKKAYVIGAFHWRRSIRNENRVKCFGARLNCVGGGNALVRARSSSWTRAKQAFAGANGAAGEEFRMDRRSFTMSRCNVAWQGQAMPFINDAFMKACEAALVDGEKKSCLECCCTAGSSLTPRIEDRKRRSRFRLQYDQGHFYIAVVRGQCGRYLPRSPVHPGHHWSKCCEFEPLHQNPARVSTFTMIGVRTA